MLTLLLVAASLAAPAHVEGILAEAWVVANTPSELDAIRALGAEPAEGLRITPSGEVEHRVLVDREAMARLREHGVPFWVSRADHRLGPPPAGYHSLEEGEALLAELAESAPRGGLVQLGTSVQGRAILSLWLGQDPDSLDARSLRVSAAHHGDEASSFEVALDVARTLVEGDGVDPALTGLLDHTTVWLVPWVNPDGVVLGQRYNARGVDINRNYGHKWSASSQGAGDAPFSEPETRAMRTLGLYEPASHSLSLHSGDTNLGWVWNWTPTPTPDEDVLEDLAESYAAACTTEGFWITNGAAWYTTRGDANDWAYGSHGGMDYTLEVTREKTPPASKIPTYVAEHRDAILAFLLRAPTLEGRVVDRDTGRPLPAQVRIYRAAGPSSFTTDPVSGLFARHAGVGEVELTAWSPGYLPTRLDTRAEPDADPLDLELERLGPSPGRPEPGRLTHSGRVLLPGAPASSTVTLSRVGLPSVELPLHEGGIEVDVDELAPGPWSLVFEDGSAWPRSLFVVDEGLVLRGVEQDDTSITLLGTGFAVGTRAFALWGADRALTPVSVLAESDTEVRLDASDLPVDETVDLLLLSNGVQQAILDVTGDPDVDTAAPQDTGSTDSGLELVSGGCSCNGTGTAPLWLPWFLLALRRRAS